jgi:glycosyltransferase involved in cell wall biosynthesis
MGRVRDTYPEGSDLFTGFAAADDLPRLVENDAVVVATHHASAGWLRRIARALPSVVPAYYVQDYEPLFAADADRAAAAAMTYTALPGQVLFAKTDWLCELLSELHDVPVAKVEPSLDAELFHARERRPSGPVRLTAMLRPRTPRRAAATTAETLSAVAARHGDDVVVNTFGCDPAAARAVDPDGVAQHAGILRRGDVARLLRDTDVFVDCSWYQAFGRTALEAMACGATAVLPAVGGAGEFAEHRTNAMIVDTLKPRAVADAIGELVADRSLLSSLQRAAVDAAARYSCERAALSEYVLFAGTWLRRRVGGGAASKR